MIVNSRRSLNVASPVLCVSKNSDTPDSYYCFLSVERRTVVEWRALLAKGLITLVVGKSLRICPGTLLHMHRGIAKILTIAETLRWHAMFSFAMVMILMLFLGSSFHTHVPHTAIPLQLNKSLQYIFVTMKCRLVILAHFLISVQGRIAKVSYKG